jgi:ABC-type transport system substrate-binding protein
VRTGKFMVWRVGSSAASPDGQPSFDKGATVHKGGQNLARFSSKQFDALYDRMSVIPDGPERQQLFYEGKRMLAAYAPYHHGVHRIHTDLTWPWVAGYRRPPYWLSWWAYIDIDASQQQKAG